MSLNIAIAGGPCTGKSTTAAALFAKLKIAGFDYDLVTEEGRSLKREFGSCRTTFERLYLWRQQEREELRSTAKDGFVTDSPLFHQFTSAKYFTREPREELATRELLRMCMEIEHSERYHLITVPKNVYEIPFKNDQARTGGEASARARHALVLNYLQLFQPNKLLFVTGSVNNRVNQIFARLAQIRNGGK